jgi:preprotein translocase subunit SecA
MEASILSRQIENAQKKVEEQNFVSRKNVLKYDDVMNTQRMVIYEQRSHVLAGDDLSDEIRQWIEDVVAANVTQFTDAETSDEWDLLGLVAQMHALYGTDITVEELGEEIDVESREALIEEFVGDALDTYAEREEAFTPEMTREIERYVILRIVDTRWREHLESMDYLREGVHLRAMAQKDPLVEYRGEGHAMFEELGRAIREEVVLTLFHVEVEPDDAEQLQPAAAPQGLAYEHEQLQGADAIAAAGGGLATAVAPPPETTSMGSPMPAVNEHRDIGRNDPCWCGSGKKYKRCHGA